MGAFFSHKTEQRLKIGKIFVFSSVLLLCIYQIQILYLIYKNEKNEYIKNFSLHAIETSILHNLPQSPDSSYRYCSYNIKHQHVHIIKEDQNIDTIISLTKYNTSKLIECQATYDIRDTNYWKLDTLGNHLLKTLQKTKLLTPFRLTLTNQTGKQIGTFSYKNPYHHLFVIHKELDLGFIDQHHLKISFTYPFHLFWNVASDRIIITIGLFVLLLFLSISLYLQLKDERKSNEYRKKFTHTLVHNFRSPLLSAKQHLSAIKSLPLSPEKQEEYLNLSITNTGNVLKNIEKLLTLSVNTYGLTIHRELFKPSVLMRQLHKNYQQEHPNKKVVISIDCLEELIVYADKSHLEGALNNLIENSILYSGPKVHIQLTCYKIKKKIFISIEDDGLGIPVQDQPHIFEENYRGISYKQTNSHNGFGLGLFYVQMVVKAHHGKISVSSDGTSGTKFEIEIPEK